MFRNLRFYRVLSPWPQSEADLSECLQERAFRPCSAFSERSAGWEAPVDEQPGLLCRRLDGADLLQLRTQSRVLPPAAVREALADRVAEFRERTGEDPKPGEIRRLKEETRDELMPKSLLRSERTRACFLASESVLVIDEATVSKAEWFIDQLRPCIGRFDARPLAFNQAIAEFIRRIFFGEDIRPFDLGRECRLQDPSDRAAVGVFRNIDLNDEAIRRHVRDGMKLTHLGLGFEDAVSLLLADDGVVTKLRMEGREDGGDESLDALARFDAEFVLMAGAVRRLLAALQDRLGGFAS